MHTKRQYEHHWLVHPDLSEKSSSYENWQAQQKWEQARMPKPCEHHSTAEKHKSKPKVRIKNLHSPNTKYVCQKALQMKLARTHGSSAHFKELHEMRLGDLLYWILKTATTLQTKQKRLRQSARLEN